MSCAYPSYSLSVTDIDGSLIPIPCGQCFNCRLDYQRRTIDRLHCAWHSWTTSAFVTFTYDDEHLFIPDGFINASLSKEHLHKFFDNIRHKIPFKFEYYVCGEYGDKFNRPHYHALFFGLDYELHKSFFEKTWKYGSVKVLPVTPKAFRYVTKYITKKCTYNDSQYYDYGLVPPFRKMSRGLGMSVYRDHIDSIARYGYFVFKGRKIFVNRYYFNKLLPYNKELVLNRDLQRTEYNENVSRETLQAGYDSVDAYKFDKVQNLERQLEARSLNKIGHL